MRYLISALNVSARAPYVESQQNLELQDVQIPLRQDVVRCELQPDSISGCQFVKQHFHVLVSILAVSDVE